MRFRPVGVVIADICRDLGIVVSHPLWRQLFRGILESGGNPATLFRDICKRVGRGLVNRLAAMQQAAAASHPPAAVAAGIGPP